MALLLSVLLILSFLALEWYIRAAMLTPLPKEVRMVFSLDRQSEPKLESAVRCFRFLKQHRLIQGIFVIVQKEEDPELLASACLLEKDDIIIEKLSK